MDIARGVGICLVVLGHNPMCQQGGWVYAVIFSFHMPLFYFLSGYFHKAHQTLGDDLSLRAKKLLIPYFFTAIVYLFAKFLASPSSFISQELRPMAFGIIWGAGGRGSVERYMFWPPLWFLTSLFATQVVYLFIEKYIIRGMQIVSRAFLFGCLLTCGIYYIKVGGQGYLEVAGVTLILSENGWPFNVDLVPISIFFFWLGVEFRNLLGRGESITALFRSPTALLVSVSIFVVVIWISFDPGRGSVMDLNLRNFGQVGSVMLLSIVGIFCAICLGHVLVPFSQSKAVSIIMFLGQYSLPILVFHHVVQKNVAGLLPSPGLWWIALMAGIFFPALASKFLFSRFKTLTFVYSLPAPKP